MIHLRFMQYYVARARLAYAKRDLATADLFLRYAIGEANRAKRPDFRSRLFSIRNRLTHV